MTRRARIGAQVVAVAGLVALLLLVWCRREPTRDAHRTDITPHDRPQTVAGQTANRVAPPRYGRPAPPLQRLTLRGVVVERDGVPVAGATVALVMPHQVVRSGRDGTFELANLLPGRYALEAHHGARSAATIGVELDANTGLVTLRLYQGFNLEVEVVAADNGKPIAGAEVEVSLISMYPGAGRQRASTGADGVARLEGLTFIGHDLRVAAPGFVDDRRGPGPDLVERTSQIRRIRIALARAAAEIAGRLVDERGAPIAGGEIEAVAYRQGDRALDDARVARSYGVVDAHAALRTGLGTRSDASGTFRIGLDTGTWVLIASAAEREIVVSEPIFVEAGSAARREITLSLKTGRTLRGVVVDGADREVAAAHVEARWLDGTRVLGSTVTDGGGGFELRGLPSAPIEIVARTSEARSRPVGVDLVSSNVDGAVIALDLTTAITGRVVDDRGDPIPEAVITYLEEQPATKTSLYPDVAVADRDGQFRLAGVAPRVTYFISAARPQDGSFGQHAAGTRARGGEDVTIKIPAGGAIVGRIVGAADPRKLVIRDQQTLTAARPNADGAFRLDHLPALRYQLHVSGQGIADTYVHDIDVAANRDTDLGDVVVRAGRKVAGVVVDVAGKPVDAANVRVEVDNRYAIVTRCRSGRFTLNVPAGLPLLIMASHLEHGRSAAVALGPGDNVTALRLAMLAGGTIRGRAEAHGRALADAPVTVWPIGSRPTEPIAAVITDDAGSFAIPAVPAGRWLVELGIPALEREHRVLQQGVEVAIGKTAELAFDASDAPSGTIVQPRPEHDDLPVYGDDEPDPEH